IFCPSAWFFPIQTLLKNRLRPRPRRAILLLHVHPRLQHRKSAAHAAALCAVIFFVHFHALPSLCPCYFLLNVSNGDALEEFKAFSTGSLAAALLVLTALGATLFVASFF